MHSDVFLSELESDEKILWSGKPDLSRILNNADFLFIPLGLFPVFGSIVMILMGFGVIFSPEEEESFLPFVVFLSLIPMTIGFYLSFGRLIHKRRKRNRTYYALTNNRVIMITKSRRTRVTSLPLKDIKEINKSKHLDGNGTIYFGRLRPFSFFEDSGLDFFSEYYAESCVAFRDIKNVDEVHKLVRETSE